MNKLDLMSYADYVAQGHTKPYSYHLSKNNQHLYFFGSIHTYNEKDEQIKKIEEFWNNFVVTTKNKKRLVLVEGGTRKILSSKKESIEIGGEISYVAFLSDKEDIDMASPEPSPAYWFHTLANKFSRDQVAYYDFARICYQWNKANDKTSFTEYVKIFLESNSRNSGWDDYDFSLEHFKDIHKQFFKTEFDENDEKFFYKILNPTTSYSVINQVSLADDEGVRDTFIFSEIEKYWKEGNNVFIIFGLQHAVIMESALRKLTEE